MIYTVATDLPGTVSTMAAPDPARLAELREQGVDVLVSLLPAEQAAVLGLADEEAAATAAGLGFHTFPIADFGVPDRAAAEAPLAALTAELAEGRHVVVHCWGGIGRSSLVAAALLVRTGVAPDDAWARIAEARGVPVPETQEQRDWVSP